MTIFVKYIYTVGTDGRRMVIFEVTPSLGESDAKLLVSLRLYDGVILRI
jgi:hypothetical protein